jgi:hypothetical protein
VSPAKLVADEGAVFSKRAVLWASVCPQDACRDAGVLGRRRESRAVRGGRAPVRAREAGRERADALEADREADLRDRTVGIPQQGRRTLETAGQQVRMWRLTEGAPELAAEMRARQPGRRGQVVHAKRLEVPGVGQILRAEEVTISRDVGHAAKYALRRGPVPLPGPALSTAPGRRPSPRPPGVRASRSSLRHARRARTPAGHGERAGGEFRPRPQTA